MPKGGWREFINIESRPNQSEPIKQPNENPYPPKEQQSVRVKKTRGGKNGKTVTMITGLEISDSDAKELLKRLKARASTGGTFKQKIIELQGEQVSSAIQLLKQEGYLPKQSGG